uniref:AT-hook containing transcription factor 1 n=1 Tax=Chelonoidis abingdonii TaxID=106734 RepID=A0A8C0J1P0_CHEAB
MRDLTAQVTSSLLQFPEVTVQALGEDEITLESVLRGRFAGGRNGLACLACGPQLEVVNSITGERLSAYRFNGVSEHPPTILVVKEFSWQKRTGLLVGLEEAEGSVLCLYDLGVSRVVKAVVLPGRVTAIEPIINHGGARVSTQHLHQSLRWLFGVAAVVTDVGHILLIDLCLDDLSCSQNEIEASDLEVITGIPVEIPQIREAVTREGRHLCFQLLSPSGAAVTTLCYISRSNQLVVGFSDGYLSLWNMKTLKKEYHCQLEGGRIPVYAVTFQEPENDPRNCCYLWAVQSTQESEGDVVSLHLLQLAFGDRKRLASGQITYEGLEYCEERYSLDLTGGVFSLRGQTSNTKLLSCQTIEKFRSHVDREDGVNEVISPDTSVSVFSWQVNTYGQGKPSTYLGIFDINRWYHAQMPDSLRPGEFLHNCPYFALWSLDAVVSMTSSHHILDILVHERSLSRGVPPSYPPPEQFFNPSTYTFDATCLLNSGVIHMTCTGFQKETLHFLKKSGSFLNEAIPDNFNRCLIAGLLSPRLIDVQPSSLSQEEQLEAILSAAVQTSSLGLLTGCIKQWTAEEQPNSAANLRFVLEWTWNKVIYTKDEFDRMCVPLFDGSCNFIDPQTIQSLQHCQLLLSNLSTVLNCFLTEAQELTERGFTDLTNKQFVTSLISQYAHVVIWFCRSSLLPEGLDDDMQLSRPFYNYPIIQSYCTGHRQKLERLSRGKWNADCLMIDGLLSQFGDQVEKLWRRDEGGTGKYPPASLHALLDLYLLQNIEETYKHAITIYLLLDIMHSFPNKTETSFDSFPTAFAIPWGLVRLVQGFWLLDHNDYESSLALLFHPATIKTMSWQHMKIIQALMCQGEHRRALRYIQMMKPSMSSSSEVALHLTVLLYNRCMVEAWSLLQQHSTRLNVEELLKHMYEVCQEMGLMEDLLKLPFTDTEQECLEKFLQTSAGIQNHEFLLVHHLQRANYIPALQLNQSLKVNLMNDRDPRLRERSVARNSILDQFGKILPRVQRKLAVERAKPYHLSSSVLREVSRPKPLSTVVKQTTAGNVLTRATFINNVLSKIGEVWVGNEQKSDFSQYNSPRTEEPPPMALPFPDTELPDPFVGTPVTKSSHKSSRLLDLVVRPVPLCSPSFESNWQTPCRASTSCTISSPLQSNSWSTILHTNISRASEFNLLETPLVVKRAKALATSSAASGFPGITLQSILRSSLRTTPLATPSASPGRSITPPLRAKELRISFREENATSRWTAGVSWSTVDDKTKHLLASSEHNLGVQMEDTWSKDRDKVSPFTLTCPEEDHAEMNESSEGIAGDVLEKMEVSKETSNFSARSDQTTLEYHDARSPDDLEDDVIFITSKPANSPAKDVAIIQEEMEEEGSEVVKSEPLQFEQQTSSELEKQTGMCCHVKFTRKKSLSAVISILHSEDIPSTDSENQLQEERSEDLHEDQKSEEAAIEENVLFLQEKTFTSKSLPETKELNVKETVETALFNEQYPSGTLKLQYNCDAIKQQFTCDLPDSKDTNECDTAEGDGELFMSESNFTLILEGEDGETETGDPTTLDMSTKPVSTKTEDKHMNHVGTIDNQQNITNSVPAVTSDQESQNIADAFPYVPEPVKVALAENLLDIIKDTRSKEFTSEVVEQSVHESIPLMSKKITISQKSIKAPLTTVPEANADNASVCQVDHVVTPKRPRGRKRKNLNIPSTDAQQLSNTGRPDLLGLCTLRRSARRAKETSAIHEGSHLDSDGNSQDPQIPQIPDTPKRGPRKTRGNHLETSDNVHSIGQSLQMIDTPRRGLRRTREPASVLPEQANEEIPLAEEAIKLPATSKRTGRGAKSSVGNQENSQLFTVHKVKMAVSPIKSGRKLKSVSLQLTENIITDQESEPYGQQLPVPTRRGRRKKTSTSSEVSENCELDTSKPSHHQMELKSSVTTRRNVSRRTLNLSAGTDSIPTQEAIHSEETEKMPDTPKRRATRVTPAKAEKTGTGKPTLQKTPVQPVEALGTTRTSARAGHKNRKRQLQSVSEESTEEEGLPQGTDYNPSLLVADLTESRLDEMERTLAVHGTRITRTRSSKIGMHQKLSLEENESFFFSPPLTKLTKKSKAGKAEHPVQLKDLDPELSSQFVFSPPLLRSRRKHVSSISRIVKELVIEFVGKQKVKRRRTTKSKTQKASKTTGKECSWSPPPVEIKFISPFGSPVCGTKTKQKETAETAEKTLRKNKKRLSNFPKPVVRRKML